MSVSISVTIDTRELERIARQLDVKKHEVGKKLGPMVLADAKGQSPVDTGLLKSSIELQYPGGDVLARIQTNIEYGKYQELGFHHYISGKFIQNPFLVPAIEMNTGIFFSPSTWRVLFE
jgi:hypothetical protein